MMFESHSLQKPLPYYQQIQESIKDAIFKGIFKPGDRLYEAQLAKQYGISRSPVREAIKVLINEGLLLCDDKSQITVYKPALEDVIEIYECRIALETAAVALTAERATADQIRELEKSLEDTAIAIETENLEKIVACNAHFHDLTLLYSGNNRLIKLVDSLNSLIYYYRFLNMQGQNRPKTILKGHTEIFQAINEKNPEKAASLLKAHTLEDLENLTRLIEDGE
ncbi:MAG: GntR family transcriptional regulator [Bacillota bacterium]|nr:GntR family transcriptional regulator [Bacillota bacterium]